MEQLIKEKINELDGELKSLWILLYEYCNLEDSSRCYSISRQIMVHENELLTLNQMIGL